MQKKRLLFFIMLILAGAFIISLRKEKNAGPVAEKKTILSKKPQQKEKIQKPLVIEIDPGHGGKQGGAEIVYEGRHVMEKDINLKIAKNIQKALSQYPEVKVYMTRNADKTVGTKERSMKAKKDKAHLLVSIHNNAKGQINDYENGCTVLAATGNYKPSYAKEEQELACCILAKLGNLGLENQGIMLRTSETGEIYPNGKLCDYYNIVRNSLLLNIRGIIIEHAFLDHKRDYQQFLSSDKKLEELGKADADAIAEYYGLGNKKNQLANVEEEITLITDSKGKSNQHYRQGYFEKKE